MPPPPENLVGTLRLFQRLGFERAIRLALVHAGLAGSLLGRDDEPGIRHAEWLEDVFAEIIVEPLLAHRFNNAPDPVDAGAVFPALARIEHQRDARQFGLAGRAASH